MFYILDEEFCNMILQDDIHIFLSTLCVPHNFTHLNYKYLN